MTSVDSGVTHGDVGGGGDLEAGAFGMWVTQMRESIDGDHGSDVPCGTCTACCTSSQFIHITPDETDTLAHIPKALLFPAPRLPEGHVLMPYNDRGHCPMLIDFECSIYEHRPMTCRTYDCRIFPAAGLKIDEPEKGLIAAQTQRWRFQYPATGDETRHHAVTAAGSFLRDHVEMLEQIGLPTNTTQLAVLAVEFHDLFIGQHDDGTATTLRLPEVQGVRVELTRRVDARRRR